MDVAGWCTSTARGALGSIALGARATDPRNAYSWECTTYGIWPTVVRQSGVDMNAACRWKNGRGNAGLRNSRDAYSWYCVY